MENNEDILSLVAHTVEVFAYNRKLDKWTWEPMIFAEFGPVNDDGSVRVKFVPRQYSEAFPGDIVGHWTMERIQRWVRPIEEDEVQA